MAEIVQTLFGVSPESYQQQQSALADQRALQYAKLDPFQQANYAIGRGAYGLAGAIGGALGGQDPELQKISQRQQIAGQIDYNDDASMKQGIVALAQGGDAEGAMQLQQILLSQQAKRASIGKDEAAGKASLAAAGRERLQGIPNDIQLAREISSLQEQISQFTALPASPERDQALRLASGQLSQLERLTAKPGKDIIFGADREAASLELYGKTYIQLSLEERADVNKSLVKPEPAPNVGPDREATSLANFGKPFNKLDQTQQAAVNVAIVKPESAPSFGADREAEAFANFGRSFASLNQQQQSFVNSKVAKPEPVATFGNEREAEAQANFGTSFSLLNRQQQEFVNKIVGKTAGGVTFGTDANRISLELFAKPFGDLSQSEQAAVNKRVEGEKKASAPNLTVVNAVQKGFGENLTETITSTVKAGRVARQTIGAVDNMQTLLDEGVRTGFGQETMLQIGKVGQLLNPDFNVGKLAGAEALQSISTSLVLPQVKQLGVNPTDTDLKFINTGSPGLSKTVAGNKLMLSALRLKLEREQDAAAFTNNWLGQNAKLTTTNPTEGYVKYNSDFDKYTQSSPLYAPASNKLREQFNALGGTAPGATSTPRARDATNRGGLTRP